MKEKCNGFIHKVESHDTMYRIAKKYGIRLVDLMNANPYVNVYNLQPGDEICVPREELVIQNKQYYITKPEDTVNSVLEMTGISLSSLFENNKIMYELPVPAGLTIKGTCK